MEPQQVEKLKHWFDDYVVGFYGNDEFVNAHIKLKDTHSRRTCKEMLYLVDGLGLTDNQKRIAEVIALFHDVGRFEQFSKYRTYSDHVSVNHSQLGLDVISRTKVFDILDEGEKQLIEKAIEHHGKKQLPADLDESCLLFSKLIRDADKLDIFFIALNLYDKYNDDRGGFMVEMDFPDKQGYSDGLVKQLLCGERINYTSLKSWDDMKLLQLGWVYDVNFTATLKRIKKCKFLERIIDFLPETEDSEKIREKILSYVEARIEQDGQ